MHLLRLHSLVNIVACLSFPVVRSCNMQGLGGSLLLMENALGMQFWAVALVTSLRIENRPPDTIVRSFSACMACIHS